MQYSISLEVPYDRSYPFQQPYFITEGVFTVGQFLEEARTFADTAREQLAVRDAFDDLERRLNAKETIYNMEEIIE